MALSPVYAAILQDLNKAVAVSQPEDVLQFCANWVGWGHSVIPAHLLTVSCHRPVQCKAGGAADSRSCFNRSGRSCSRKIKVAIVAFWSWHSWKCSPEEGLTALARLWRLLVWGVVADVASRRWRYSPCSCSPTRYASGSEYAASVQLGPQRILRWSFSILGNSPSS